MLQKKYLLFAIVVATLVTINASAFDNIEIDPRIIQGENATRGQFPYYAFLKVQLAQGEAACGGSLISNQYVVTAAHCLKGAAQVEVHLGSLKASNRSEAGRVIVQVDRRNIFVHPKYIQFIVLNDIGLIKLPKPVEFSETIQPVSLACSSANKLNVIAIGNGLMHTDDKTIAPTLQYTHLETISLLKCLLKYPTIGFRKSVVCARGVQQRSTCQGDSGGPLVSANSGALIGLTSFGAAKGCHLGYPQAYTRIASYLEWIEEVTDISDCKNDL